MKLIKYLFALFIFLLIIGVILVVYLFFIGRTRPKPISTLNSTTNQIPSANQTSSFFGSQTIEKITPYGDELASYIFIGEISSKITKKKDLYDFEMIINSPDKKPVLIKFVTSGIILSTSVHKETDRQTVFMMGVFSQMGKPVFSLPDNGYLKNIDKEIIEGRETKVRTWFLPKEILVKIPKSCCSSEHKKAIDLLTDVSYMEQTNELYAKYKENQTIPNQPVELPIAGIEIITN